MWWWWWWGYGKEEGGTLSDGCANVQLAVRAQWRVGLRIRDQPFDAAAAVGDDLHMTERPVALERDLQGKSESQLRSVNLPEWFCSSGRQGPVAMSL